MPSLSFISQQITIYVGIGTLIVGILGGFLNALVFLSLRTFRQSSCAFYLIAMSIINVGQLAIGLFTQIMISGFAIDWTLNSLFYCKFKAFAFQTCTFLSLTCFCLATIDQFLATSSRPRWQQWCNVKLAYRLFAIALIVWLLHGIPYLLFVNQVQLPTTGQVACINTNDNFRLYLNYVTVPIVGRVAPLTTIIVFGSLAYRNVQELAYRTVPLVRRELEKQLTVMVLVQVVFTCFAILPYLITACLMLNTNFLQDPVIAAQLQFANTLTTFLYYTYFASPFYIYVCVSERFRRQLKHVLFTIHLNRWRPQRIIVNQVVPQAS